MIAVEYEAETTHDLIAAARVGLELIDDFLSAITVVSGTTFGTSEVVQVARRDPGKKLNCEFMQILPLPLRHWHERISEDNLNSARRLLAHWDGLENGHRLRRAARSYRSAAGVADSVSAFLEAHMGLEALEKPLALHAGLTPGSEEVEGSCEHCGHKYTRKRTTLVGVRAYVHGSVDGDTADQDRKSDWKLISKLRTDLTHGLVDEDELGQRPDRALLSSMHYLHSAICTCSHAYDLDAERYVLARGGVVYVLLGRYSAPVWTSLLKWDRVIATRDFTWVSHDVNEFVPELGLLNDGVQDLQVGFGRLNQPMSIATMSDISRVEMELD